MPERSFTQYIKSNFNDAFTAVDGFVSDNINELDLETRLVEYIDEHELSGIEIMQVYANDSECSWNSISRCSYKNGQCDVGLDVSVNSMPFDMD